MTVTDEAKLFAVRQQLIESQRSMDAAIKIINYVFERDATINESPSSDATSTHFSDCDPIIPTVFGAPDPTTGLYPGQKEDITLACEEESTIEECVE